MADCRLEAVLGTVRQGTARALVHAVRSSYCHASPVPIAFGRAHISACLVHGLDRLPPAAVRGVANALAWQGFMHGSFFAAALRRMDRHALSIAPPVAIRDWIGALVATRTPIPAEHLASCLISLRSGCPLMRWHPLVTAPRLLRTLLLARVTPSDRAALLQANGCVDHLLSAISSGGPGRSPGVVATASLAALTDVAWIIEHQPPSWLKPVRLQHDALLQAVRLWHKEPQSQPTENLAEGLCKQPRVEEAARAALIRLRCRPQSRTVSHLQIPLALPELRIAIECPGPIRQLRDLEEEKLAVDMPTAAGAVLSPLTDLRHSQLRNLGWSVEVVLDSEWPAAVAGDDMKLVHRREELLLRQRLAGCLQQGVPPNRRR